MGSIIVDFLENVSFGDVQSFKNITFIPVFHKNGDKLEYVPVDEMLESKQLKITEVSEGGSVPELMVDNQSDKRILLLDGEELVGAKQNRVLNTTILLEKQSQTKIPVSCVEQGRWGYSSRKFSISGRTMPSSSKFSKSGSVSRSLRTSRGKSYSSNQSEVWNEVDRVSSYSGTYSKTRAMSDVYENKKVELEELIEPFSFVESQKGMVVFLNGRIAGLEYVSRSDVFKVLFPKLLKGYGMDAILNKSDNGEKEYAQRASLFLENIKLSKPETYKAVGLGEENRMESDFLLGSSLVIEDEVVHLNAMSKTLNDNSGRDYRTSGFIRRMMR
jgi:hypothetical protein